MIDVSAVRSEAARQSGGLGGRWLSGITESAQCMSSQSKAALHNSLQPSNCLDMNLASLPAD